MAKHKVGDTWINSRGELCIKTETGRKHYYRYIVEKYINYRLSSEWTIHHIDGNHHNNDLENLMIVSKELHEVLHQTGIALKDKFVSNLDVYKNLKGKSNER